MSNTPYPNGMTTFINDIQPRLQCNNNNGYCGEVSMQSAGLYYGQYISQYEVRSIYAQIAQPGIAPDKEQTEYELLLGVTPEGAGQTSAELTAHALRLDHNVCTGVSPEVLLAWVKKHVALGHPVIIGVFNNEYMLYNNNNPNAGDLQYDHIVPAYGFGSYEPDSFGSSSENAKYLPSDIIMFSDNGLYTQPGQPLGYTPPLQGYIEPYQYFFTLDTGDSSPVYDFILDRADANASDGNIYSLRSTLPTFGIAITGINDPNGETFPVRIVATPDHEPNIGHHGTNPPSGIPMTLIITVSGLTAGESYNLYQYDNYKSVPTSDFNKNSTGAKRTVITPNQPDNTSWSGTVDIKSDQQAFFRVVKANS